jgi:hypothetical protein
MTTCTSPASARTARAVPYDYAEIRAASERVDWRVEDLIGPGRELDFTKPFMPESLARCAELDFLSAADRLLWNQVRGHQYLFAFGLVEEFILPFVLEHTHASLDDHDERTRALLDFASEEAKHMHLFKRFRDSFLSGFRQPCEVIGPRKDIAQAVLAHPKLSVALVILQIEWMSQRHYVESIRDEAGIDERFRELLRNHWMEEAQHAKLDTLITLDIAATLTRAEIEAAVDGYFAIGGMLDAGMAQQLVFDIEAFERARGLTLSADERARLVERQTSAIRWTFLGSGMSHPRFLETLGRISPGGRARVEEAIPAFS